MSRSVKHAVLGVSLWSVLLLVGCGGGTDVGNPYQPITGMVTLQTSDGTNVTGARVVLARRGADPGLNGSGGCPQNEDLTICPTAIYFDTTYTDVNGRYRFDSLPPEEYVLVASYDDLVTLEYIDHSRYEEDVVNLVVTDPSTVTLRNYTAIDTARPHFVGARIAGTEITGLPDTDHVITLNNVPEGQLDLVLYRSDNVRKRFDGLRTTSGCSAELYTLPGLSPERWTPHPCGIREPLGLPYILDYLSVEPDSPSSELRQNSTEYDLQIHFSHAMDVISTGNALHAEANGDSVEVASLWWQGANTVYLKLCTFDTAGSCRTGEGRFLQGVTYGVTIDTSAQTALGVPFAYEADIRFVPVP